MAVDSTSFNNPYANPYASLYGNYASSGLNDDFMANAYFSQNGATNPAFTGGYGNLSGQPQVDTFQRSSGTGAATLMALTAGGATTAGLYFHNGSLVNPFKDGKFDDSFLKHMESDLAENVTKAETEALKKAQLKALAEKGITYNEAEINAIKAVAESDVAAARAAGHTIPVGITDKAAAEAQLAKINEAYATVNETAVRELAKKQYLNANSLEGSKAYLQELKAQQALIEKMGKDEKLLELIKKNPKAFGIQATEEAKIAEEAQKLIGSGKRFGVDSKAAAEAVLKSEITAQGNVINDIRTGLTNKINLHWDSSAKRLAETAPESLTKAFKNVKLAKAGKWGLAAAGVGAVVGWLFGK